MPLLTTGAGIYSSGDPNFSSIKLLTDFPGVDTATSLTEESSSARVATFVNQAQIDTAQFQWSPSSLLLDGTQDVVTFPNSADFQFGNGSWTIELWTRLNAVPGAGNDALFVSLYDSNAQRSWYVAYNGNGLLRVVTSTDGVATAVSLSVAATLVVNTWYLLEYNYDGTNLRAFRDGTFIGKAAFSSTLFASTSKLTIGGLLTSGAPPAGNFYVNGWIGGVRLTKGICRHPADTNYTPTAVPFPRS